jgi:hypothetical protein
VQGRGAVRHHGVVDSRLDKVNALIPPEDGFAGDGGGNRSVCGGQRCEFAGPLVLLASHGAASHGAAS